MTKLSGMLNPAFCGIDPHLIQSQLRPLMSVLTRRGYRTVADLGHIATWLDQWPGVPSGFGNMFDPQLRKLAVFDTKRHPNGRKTPLQSASDQEMLSMGFEPIAETDRFRHRECPCAACRSPVEPYVISRLRRLKNGQIKRTLCLLPRTARQMFVHSGLLMTRRGR